MMAKYKLIKEYPGSPKLETEIKYTENGWRCPVTDFAFFDDPKKYSEFWELVKEYEILRLYDGFNTFTKLPNGRFTVNVRYEYAEKDLLKKGHKITKIKRLSNGKVFSTGDRLISKKNKGAGSFILSEIEFEIAPADKGTRRLSFIHDHKFLGKWLSLEDLEHYKKPILITEDKVELFKKDRYYRVMLKSFGMISATCTQDTVPLEGFKYFSTKEAAEKFIEYNELYYTKKDILEFAEYLSNNSLHLTQYTKEGLFECWQNHKILKSLSDNAIKNTKKQ